MPNEDQSADTRFDTGMRVRRAVLGAEHVDRAMANQTAFDAPFQRFITEVFNEVNGIKPSRTPADEATATDVVALQRLRSRVVAVVTAMAP